MNKLIVAGCSVSDYTEVDKVWGEYLAEYLGYSYDHEAKGCGSNYRMWRVLSTKIIKGLIDPSDTVIVQYTTLERNEFWSLTDPATNPDHLREPYGTGSLIRFKSHSFAWYPGNEKKFLKLYERFIDKDYEQEKFINNHTMFQCLAKEYRIENLYFVKVGSYGFLNMPMIKKYKNNNFEYQDIFNNRENHLPDDPGHLSNIGHQTFANKIYKELTK